MCGKLLVTNKLTALVTHHSVLRFSYSLNELLVGNSYFSLSETSLSPQNFIVNSAAKIWHSLSPHLIEKVPLNPWLPVDYWG